MARNKQQQRIDGPTLRPTQGLTDNFVAAHSPNQINMEGAAAADWTEGFKDLLESGERAVVAHRKAEDKSLVEAGEAVYGIMKRDNIPLDKAVAKFTASGDTPQGLRKRMRDWTVGGKMAKSASPYFRRTVEEGQNTDKASRWETLQASQMDKLVALAKGRNGMGGDEMMKVIQEELSSNMTDDMYEGLSTYGAGHLTKMLVASGSKIAGLALAKAEDELAQETLDSASSLLVDTTNQQMDTTDATIANMNGSIPGASVDLNLDAEEFHENDPLHSQYARYADSTFDVSSTEKRRAGLVNAVGAQFDAYSSSDMSYDDKVEFVEHAFEEAARARTRGGAGDYFLPQGSAEYKLLMGRKNAALKQLKYDKDDAGGDRSKGYELGLERMAGSVAGVKRANDWTADETQEVQAILREFNAMGSGFAQGAAQAMSTLQSTIGKTEPMTPAQEEQKAFLEKDPVAVFTQVGNVPLGKSPDEVSQWLTDSGFNNTDFRVAWSSAIATEDSTRRGNSETINRTLLASVQKVARGEFSATFGDVGKFQDPSFAPIPTELEREVANDPVTREKVQVILDQYKRGEIQLDEVTISIESNLKKQWDATMNNRGNLEEVRQRQEREISDAMAATNAQRLAYTDEDVDTPRQQWVEEGAWTENMAPKDPIVGNASWWTKGFGHGRGGRAGVNDFFFEMSNQAWVGPRGATKEEWAADVRKRMALFEDLPVAREIEAFVRDMPNEKDLQKQVEDTASWIDGKWMEYFSTVQSPHSETYGFMDEDFYDYLADEYVDGINFMPLGMFDASTRAGILKNGSGEDFVNSYGQYLKTAVPTQQGWMTLPESIPNFSVIGLPDTIPIEELREVYPDTAAVGDDGVELRYREDRLEIGDPVKWVVDEGREQKIRGDIQDIVSGRPAAERHWAACQRVFEVTYNRPYLHKERQDRKNISHIWRYLSEQETKREISYK